MNKCGEAQCEDHECELCASEDSGCDDTPCDVRCIIGNGTTCQFRERQQ